MRRRFTVAGTIGVPLEHDEQCRVIEWASMQALVRPETGLLFAIPNGSFKSKRAAAQFKAEGLRPGVPDLCLPIPRACYGALYIEMKRVRGGRVSPEQSDWIERLTEAGNLAVVCRGASAAIDVLGTYLDLPAYGEVME